MIYKNYFNDIPSNIQSGNVQDQIDQLRQVVNQSLYRAGSQQSFQIGSGTTGIYMDKRGLWVGSSNPDTAPLWIDITGKLKHYPVSEDWAVANLTEDKAYDADSTSTAELADVLGTLIARLVSVGLISN